MKQLSIISLMAFFLASNFVHAVVVLQDAEVLEIYITKWKGNWNAPGYKQMKDILVKVNKWELVNEEKNDHKVVEALEKSEGTLKIRIRNYPINGSQNTHDYDWLKKHKKWFRDNVSTELKLTGELSWQHLEMGWSANKKGTVLHAPVFTSKHGELKLRDNRNNANQADSSDPRKLQKAIEQQENFEQVY